MAGKLTLKLGTKILKDWIISHKKRKKKERMRSPGVCGEHEH